MNTNTTSSTLTFKPISAADIRINEDWLKMSRTSQNIDEFVNIANTSLLDNSKMQIGRLINYLHLGLRYNDYSDFRTSYFNNYSGFPVNISEEGVLIYLKRISDNFKIQHAQFIIKACTRVYPLFSSIHEYSAPANKIFSKLNIRPDDVGTLKDLDNSLNNNKLPIQYSQIYLDSFTGKCSELNFSNMKFSDVDFKNIRFERSTFEGVEFNDMKVDNTQFINCTFKECTISDTNFTSVHGCKFEDTIFENTTFNNVQFKGTTSHNTKWNKVKFDNVDFGSSGHTMEHFENVDFKDNVQFGSMKQQLSLIIHTYNQKPAGFAYHIDNYILREA